MKDRVVCSFNCDDESAAIDRRRDFFGERERSAAKASNESDLCRKEKENCRRTNVSKGNEQKTRKRRNKTKRAEEENDFENILIKTRSNKDDR
jgi:hypothetical protein